jgi:glycosyltransferase involved in cell wall biosynthesis
LVIKNPLAKRQLTHHEPKLFTFLYLGQIEEHKGVGMLLEAFRQLSLPCRLVIGGEGRLLARLKKNYRDSRITFVGGYEDPYEYLNEASCAVIPSICYENLPTVSLEAARAEIPVIGSKLGGVAEGIGVSELLFEPTLKDLTRLMRWALTNPEELQTLASAGRKKLSIPTLEEYWETIKKTVP